jgi:DNA modification methylase
MSVRILTGDARQRLRDLDAESVHCCLTSPPYFGLRDYGTAQWEGGDGACEHSVGGQVQDSKAPGAIVSGVRPGVDASRCRKCGARRVDQQIGLEATPDAYVAELVAVFRAVKRVLSDDGVVFLNLGDSYAATTKGSSGKGEKQITNAGTILADRRGSVPLGLKPKDLIGIPWRVAFALQADGWYLRQDIIWQKPNPMPESVQDRCTKSHEYLFLLSKRDRYWYDADAISEVATSAERTRNGPSSFRERPSNGVWENSPGAWMGISASGNRNRRSVWTIATEPSSLAHFAMMPTALAELCIKAGCPSGGTVLDPFAGAGTTGLVADRLGRNAVLIELNPANAAMADQRLSGDAGMFASVQAERMEAAE